MTTLQGWQDNHAKGEKAAVHKRGVTWLQENGHPEAKPLCVQSLQANGQTVG